MLSQAKQRIPKSLEPLDTDAPPKDTPSPPSTNYLALPDEITTATAEHGPEIISRGETLIRGSDTEDVTASPSLLRFHTPTKARDSLLTKPELLNLNMGSINFAAICFCMVAITLMADRYIQSGTPIDFSLVLWLLGDWVLSIVLWLSMSVWCFLVWIETYLVVKGYVPDSVGILMYALSQILLFVYPIIVVLYKSQSPLLGIGASMQICVHSMKMHSYWSTNISLHRYYKSRPDKVAKLKNNTEKMKFQVPNVEFRPFFYFLIAPTLVYASEYPRSPTLRPTYILKELIACTGGIFIVYIMVTECLLPIYHQAATLPFWYVLVKLSMPSMSIWMLMFYSIFHCMLNVFAELTYFGDREFYQDWWNATSFDEWWRKWNRPVHRWMLRHIYTDSMHTVKFGKHGASLATFLLSAVLHEFILIVSFRVTRPVLSTTMMLQMFLIYLTQMKSMQKSRWGNVAMWAAIFVGQPLMQILYCWEYFQHRN